MIVRKIIVVLGTLCMLAACQTTQKSDLAGIEVGLAAAERAAGLYTALPRCPGANPCSSQTIVDQIKAADTTAYFSVKSAESSAAAGGSPDLTAVLASVTALQNIIPIVQKGAQ